MEYRLFYWNYYKGQIKYILEIKVIYISVYNFYFLILKNKSYAKLILGGDKNENIKKV